MNCNLRNKDTQNKRHSPLILCCFGQATSIVCSFWWIESIL